MPKNTKPNINYEIGISKQFGSSNSPFITQFLFSIQSLRMHDKQKNVIESLSVNKELQKACTEKHR